MLGMSVTVFEDREEFAGNAAECGAKTFCGPYSQTLKTYDSDKDTFFVIMTRGHKGDLSFVPGAPAVFFKIPFQAVAPSEALERVQAEAEPFILDIDAAKTQIVRHLFQVRHCRDAVLRKALVELARLLHILQRHDLKIPVVRLRHPVDYPA